MNEGEEKAKLVISAQMPIELVRQLATVAAREERPLSWVVRRAAVEFVAKEKAQ